MRHHEMNTQAKFLKQKKTRKKGENESFHKLYPQICTQHSPKSPRPTYNCSNQRC